MPNYPLKVRHKIFQKKMMGYDPDEVTDFLNQVSKDIEALIQERNSLQESLEKQKNLIHDFSRKDQILQKSITNATEMSEKLKEDAHKQSQTIIELAQKKAHAILTEAQKQLELQRSEVLELKKIKVQFEANFRSLLSDHIEALDRKKSNPSTKEPQEPLAPQDHSTRHLESPHHKLHSEDYKEKVQHIVSHLLKDINLF